MVDDWRKIWDEWVPTKSWLVKVEDTGKRPGGIPYYDVLLISLEIETVNQVVAKGWLLTRELLTKGHYEFRVNADETIVFELKGQKMRIKEYQQLKGLVMKHDSPEMHDYIDDLAILEYLKDTK